MKNILSEYMLHRIEKKPALQMEVDLGPVITISRAYGCPAKIIAKDLAHELNMRTQELIGPHRWKCISKEILDQSAQELKLDKFSVKEAVNAQEKGVMDDLILSLGNKFYPSDDKVKKTLSEVIKTFAKQGHVIIVGRAGVSLTRDIKKSLHIRLNAPALWRAQIISDRQGISPVEAMKMLTEIDQKRDRLREYFEGKDLKDSMFDIIFNYQTVSEKEIIESIIQVMTLRNMI